MTSIRVMNAVAASLNDCPIRVRALESQGQYSRRRIVRDVVGDQERFGRTYSRSA